VVAEYDPFEAVHTVEYDDGDAFVHDLKQCEAGRNRNGVQVVHLNPLGLFQCTSTPCLWSILSACPPS
jgi:hypothetical protein